MSKKIERVKIFELEDIEHIEDVLDLLKRDYIQEIRYLRDRTDLSPSDRSLMHRWTSTGDDFEITELEIEGQEIHYISCSAYIETALPKENAIIEDMILPRNKRVTSKEYSAMFFGYHGRVYALLKCSPYRDAVIKSALMGGCQGCRDHRAAWGKIKNEDISYFTFGSDFFYWLASKEGKEIEGELETISIDNIKYLTNSNMNGDRSHSSEGDNLLLDAVPKTSLGTNAKVEIMGLNLNLGDAIFDIQLENSGSVSINVFGSAIATQIDSVRYIDDYLDEVILRIYTTVLPTLYEVYNKERINGSWTRTEQEKYRKQCALGAIKDLCIDNGITLEEIEGVLVSTIK